MGCKHIAVLWCLMLWCVMFFLVCCPMQNHLHEKWMAACFPAALVFHWFRSKPKMAAVGEANSTLVSKCMDFCQALASQGQVFNFSLSLGPDFTFSLDSRSKGVKSQVIKKKASPSTLRRNARRREEFMAKKQQSSPSRISSGDNDAAKAPRCDQCEFEAVSEKGLRQHIRMKHKEIEPATEILRSRKESRGLLDCSISLLSRITTRTQVELAVLAQTYNVVPVITRTPVNVTNQTK